MTIFLSLTSTVLYLTATVLLGMRLVSTAYAGPAVRAGLAGAATVGACLHGALLYQGVLTDAGLNLGFFNAASLIAWAIVLVLLVAAATRPLDNLGVFVLPLAAVTVVLAAVYPSERVLSEETGIGVEIHVVLSVLAASVLSIGAFQAVLLAFQEHRLRRKRPGKIMGILPPLQTQEGLLFQLIGLGFFLLSLSLVSGMVFLEDMFAQHLVHKTVLSLVAWVVFAVLLWGRWRHGWRGQQAIRWTLGGCVALTLAYFGSKLVLEVILGRTWY